MLIDAGWTVHSIADHYPDDAQSIPDQEWTALALEKGWACLTQDAMIWKVSVRGVPIFCLADGNLGVPEKARWLLEAEGQIMRIAAR